MKKSFNLRAILALAATLAVPAAIHAQGIIKSNNTTALNVGTSWVGGVVPASTNDAVWNSTVTAANTVAIGASTSWQGIQILGPGGAVTVTEATGNVLTLGTDGIDMSAATQNLALFSSAVAGNIAVGGNQTWNIASGRTLTVFDTQNALNESLTGSGNINVTGSGTLLLDVGDAGSTSFTAGNGMDTYTGAWTISGGLVKALRNGTHAWGQSAITLNGGTIAQYQGSWTWANNINLNTSTTSTMDDDNTSGSRSLKVQGIISGNGNLNFNNSNGFMTADLGFILTGANTMSGTVTLGAKGDVRVGAVPGNDTTTTAGNSGTLGTANVVLSAATSTLTFSHNDGSLTVANAISGPGTVRIGSTGIAGSQVQVVTFSGTNTYTGPTLINAGDLVIGATGSISNSSLIAITTNSFNSVTTTLDVSQVPGGFTTAPGQTLSLNGGYVNGSLNFAAGSTNIIAPGGSNTVGVLEINGNLNLSGGSNTLVLDINNSANDQIQLINTGSLTASGVTTLKFVPPGTGLNSGTYTLIAIDGTGTITATPANFAIVGLVSGGRPQTFSITNTGTAIELVVVGSPGNLNWVGDGIANVWSTSTTVTNWFNNVGATNDIFVQNDLVTFDDSGSATPAINVASNVTPGSVTFNNWANSYVFGGAGQISGSTALTMNGPGQVTMSLSNSFTGGVMLNSGTLAITNETALGDPTNATPASLTFNGGALMTTNTFTMGVNPNRGITVSAGGGFDVTNASTLTVSNVIAGSSGSVLTKTGNGTLILDAVNTYGGTSGGTAVNGGTVVCGSGFAIGTSASWSPGFTLQQGTVDINGQGNYVSPSLGVSSNFLFNGTFITFDGNAGATMQLIDSVPGHAGFGLAGSSSFSDVITYNGANNPGQAVISAPWYAVGTGATPRTYVVEVDPSTATSVGLQFVGQMSYLGYEGKVATIQKTGAGVMEISSTNYFPNLQVTAGTLLVNNTYALGADRSPNYGGYGSGSPHQLIVDGGTVDLNGFSPAVGALSDNGGITSGMIVNNGGSASTLTLGYSASNTVANASYAGTIANGTGAVSIIKTGTNTQVLAGADTYSGTTTVSNGTLQVASPGSLTDAGAVTILTNATFSINGGTVNDPVTVNAGGSVNGFNSGTVNDPVMVNAGGNVSLPGTGQLNLTSLNFANTGTMSFNVANGGTLNVTTAGGVTNNGGVNSILINITGTAPAPGTYTLITYSGSLNGSGYNAYALGSIPGGASYSLVNNPGASVQLVVAPAFFWTGAQSSEWTITPVGGLDNWQLSGSPVDYTNGAVVVFDDSLTGTSVVDISAANVTPANVYFNNSASNYTLQGSAAIAGATSLAKNGTNLLTVANNNIYTGPTTINAGAVQVGTNGASGSLGSGAITVSTDLQFNRADTNTVANNISGVGTVEQDGSGVLTLSGTNTYTGMTTVNAGTLVVTNGSAIADSATVTVNSNATFQVNSSETIGELITVASSTVNVQNGTLTMSGGLMLGNLAGAGVVVWNATGNISPYNQFTTSNALAFDGTLTLRGGTPSMTPTNMEGGFAGPFWLHSTGGSQLPGTAFALDTGASSSNGQDFIIGDWDANSGNRSLTLSSLTGYGTIRTDAGGTGTRNLTVVQTNNTTFNGMILSHNNGASARALSFTKNGTGSLTLAGVVGYQTLLATGTSPLTVTVLNGTLVMNATNTYTDATTVSNGVLLVNGVVGGAVTVVGGSLGGTGVIESGVTVQSGGTLFTSQSGTGTLTVSNALIFQAGSTNFVKVNATTSASDLVQDFTGAAYDGSLIVSNLSGTLANGQNFQIFSAGGTGSFANIIPATPGAGLVWNFNAASGVLGVVSSVNTNAATADFQAIAAGGALQFSWAPDHLGWQLYTNAVGLTATNSWFAVPGSASVTNETITINRSNPNVFFQLRYP